MKQRTMARLFLALFYSLAERVLSRVMSWTLALIKWTWKTSSANSIILSLLAFSILTNLFYSSRDTSEWWHERNAGKFMSRVGVGPNLIMSKAVYMRDIDEVVSNHTPAALGEYDGNPWYAHPSHYYASTHPPLTRSSYTTFLDTATLTDTDSPHPPPTTSPPTTSTARRLQRTRQTLASYRHDLLVAMRVVNSVEREMLRAEWENWLLDENNRCRQVGRMLQVRDRDGDSYQTIGHSASPGTSGGADGAQQAMDGDGRTRLDEVREWYEGYCGSCRRERGRVFAVGR